MGLGIPRVVAGGMALLFLAGSALAGIKEDEDEIARRDAMQMVENMKASAKEQQRLANIPPYPDPQMLDPKTHQGREWVSDWKQGETNRFGGLLGDTEVDVLVVPFQVQASGIERANRSLMTVLLAQALSPSVKVADPYLVSRALGDGERHLDRSQVIQLAYQLHAKRILWCYAGHKFDNRLHLYFQLQDRGELSSFKDLPDLPGKLIDTLQFSDDIPPVSVFRDALPHIVETLGYKPAPVVIAQGGAVAHAWPASLAALGQPSGNLANDAFSLQFLASLVPLDALRLRERLYERSLLIAWQLPVESPTTRLLLGRAYQGLRMRPSALAALKNAQTDEEKALVAALNGNLPELDALRTKISMSPQRLMAEIDATDIRFAYGTDWPRYATERDMLVSRVRAPWNQLLARRFVDSDPVVLHRLNNFETLILLGEEFPAAGPGIERKLRGQQIAGQLEYADLDLALGAYLNPALAEPKSKRCCTVSQWRADRLDVLDFLTQAGVANVIYTADRLATGQALYREALSYVSSIDALFGTHPAIARVRQLAEHHLAELAEGPSKQAMMNKANHSSEQANYWSSGSAHLESDRPSHISSPTHPELNDTAQTAGLFANARAALANSAFRTGALSATYHLTLDPTEQDRLLQENSGRFSGHSIIPLLRANKLVSQGKVAEGIFLLKGELKNKPLQSQVYGRLGMILLEEGRYREAADVFGQYPGFKEPNSSPLRVDNYASDIGSRLFWRGETELAVPFFKVSRSLETGSHAGMISAARLAMLDGDYRAAVALQLQAAQRYGESYRYRDYFSLLHMLGESDAAWDGFNSMVTRFTSPHVWDSALTGLQHQGRSEKNIIEWVQQPTLLQQGRARLLAGRFLAYAAMTDRVPSVQAANAVNDLTGGALPQRTPESDFVLAYAALKQKDFAGAQKRFFEAEQRNKPGNPEYSYFLPYYAVAAGLSKHPDEVKVLLDDIPAERQYFDYWLARSALAAASDAPEAADDFRKAIARRVFKEQRPLGIEYQLADVAELLFEATGNPQFKTLALQVARLNQKAQPWEAWSYAVEARWSDDSALRKRALVKAVYLDKNSERLTHLPRKEVDDAARIAVERNPFWTPGKGKVLPASKTAT